MPNLEGLLERLLRHEVEFVVIGGYAAMAHGSTYVTFDVDVCTPLVRANEVAGRPKDFLVVAQLRAILEANSHSDPHP